jgi:sulfatase maturation enzyme AslB (radical SAM superfamily)
LVRTFVFAPQIVSTTARRHPAADSTKGPHLQPIHDRYRQERMGQGRVERVMAGVRLLQKHGVDFSALACIERERAHRPLEVCRLFQDAGIR